MCGSLLGFHAHLFPFSSTPEALRRQVGAFFQRTEFGPSELTVQATTKAAISTSDHVFAPHGVGVVGEPVRNHLWVFKNVSGVAHNTRNEDFSVRQLCFLPHFPFVLVPYVSGLNGVGTSPYLEQQ